MQERPRETSSLLPLDVAWGLAGWHCADHSGNDPGVLNVTELCGMTIWANECTAICAKGSVQRADAANGWKVFVFGTADCSEFLGSVLGTIDTSHNLGGITLSDAHLRDLCWRLLPSASVFAFHPRSGMACLIRDPAGFRPLYYGEVGQELHFSTNLESLRARLPNTGIYTDKISQMLAFGHKTGRRTHWQGVAVVAPGEMVVRAPGRPVQRIQYWAPSNVFDPEERRRLEKQPIRETFRETRSIVDKALEPMLTLPRLVIPCGGGVDSSFLSVYFARCRDDITVWCINQPEAAKKEADWTEPFAREHRLSCRYVQLNRINFLTNLLRMLARSNQPLPGPNLVGGQMLCDAARGEGAEHLIFGELCDTVFGGLSGFYHVSRRFRILRLLSSLPYRARNWLVRALSDVPAWLLGTMHVNPPDLNAMIGGGDLDNAEVIQEATQQRYPGQTSAQYLADVLTWVSYRSVPGALHAAFYEFTERNGLVCHYPFADHGLIKLGLHLPCFLKRRHGRNKWLWRQIAADYVGKSVAFRRKETFPTLTAQWLDKAPGLLKNGFLEDLLCTDVFRIYASLPRHGASCWTLVNLELWARVHVRGESEDEILALLV